ncbi:MAG: hypothetical protein FWF02_13625 [Micrococcales bacterium]|nr:hypothetical protein [Micrococcales bacterium]MCL2668716.1 hypothetical protein [Micrococcales bacterium]
MNSKQDPASQRSAARQQPQPDADAQDPGAQVADDQVVANHEVPVDDPEGNLAPDGPATTDSGADAVDECDEYVDDVTAIRAWGAANGFVFAGRRPTSPAP